MLAVPAHEFASTEAYLAVLGEQTAKFRAGERFCQHEEILAATISSEFDRAADLLTDHWHDGMHRILRWLDAQERT